MPEPSRRRSDRLLLTIPIRVEGSNAKGQKFTEETRTLVINRHGARIQLNHLVAAGALVRIVNIGARRHADFRVVGPTQPISDQGGEWGVECQDPKGNIWGIDFPPASDDGSLASALLACRRCHREVLMPISLVEYDVLSTSGLLTRNCENCKEATSWGYSEQQVSAGAAGEVEPQAESPAGPAGAPTKQRAHSRVSLKLPIRVRNYYGVVDFAKTENVSKGGFCFASEKDYEIGEGIQVICPYDAIGHNIEVRARIVRRYGSKGAARKLFGARYEKEA